jgi:(2Fe-2S) ferredoxin
MKLARRSHVARAGAVGARSASAVSMKEQLDIFGRPLAERRLVVCAGPCCDREGRASANLAALRALLERRRLHEGVPASCLRRNCLGRCSTEPLARVLPDDIVYRGLSGEILAMIFERHVLNHRPIAELVLPEDE